MPTRIKSDPPTDEVKVWVKRQPKPTIGEIVPEMNERYFSYKAYSFMEPREIDKQVRQDFQSFGSRDESIVFSPDHELPYARMSI